MTLVFERYAPNWPKSPVGIFGRFWKHSTPYNAFRIIDIAKALYFISKGITAGSKPVFEQKVVELLHCRKEHQFEELVAELHIGFFLAERAKPVSMSPLAHPILPNTSKQAVSPDYGVRLPGGDVLVEVTTVRTRQIESWDRAIQDICRRITGAADRAGLLKEVEIKAGLNFRADALTKRMLVKLMRQMEGEPTGAIKIPLGPTEVKFKWRDMPMLTLPNDDILPPNPSPVKKHFSAAVASGRAQVRSATAFALTIDYPDDVEELFVRSIRNTLDGKRTQFQPEFPSILVLQLGSCRIKLDFVIRLLNERIWPNPRNAWLTGIGIFRARQTFGKDEPPHKLIVSWNPSAKYRKTLALTCLLEGSWWFSNGKVVWSKSYPEISNNWQAAITRIMSLFESARCRMKRRYTRICIRLSRVFRR